MEPVKKETPYPACGTCPEVVMYDEEVRIGEKGNLVRLKKQEWNDLVHKIQNGELREV